MAESRRASRDSRPAGGPLSLYIYIYICMYVCMYVSMYVCIGLQAALFLYIYMYVCMYVCMYVYMYRPAGGPPSLSLSLSLSLSQAALFFKFSLSICVYPAGGPRTSASAAADTCTWLSGEISVGKGTGITAAVGIMRRTRNGGCRGSRR
jgi:hypothetical protein